MVRLKHTNKQTKNLNHLYSTYKCCALGTCQIFIISKLSSNFLTYQETLKENFIISSKLVMHAMVKELWMNFKKESFFSGGKIIQDSYFSKNCLHGGWQEILLKTKESSVFFWITLSNNSLSSFGLTIKNSFWHITNESHHSYVKKERMNEWMSEWMQIRFQYIFFLWEKHNQ